MRKILLFCAAAFLAVNLAQAQTTVVVRADDLADNSTTAYNTPSWFFYDDEQDCYVFFCLDRGINNTIGSFGVGPAAPPAGIGSATMSVSGQQRRNLATYQFKNVELSEITALGFSTYNPSEGNGGGSTRSAYLHFDVNFSKGGRLIFVPSKNGTVKQDEWQDWDAIQGGDALWSWSKFDSQGGKWPDGNKNRYRTWSDITTKWPTLAVGGTGFMGLRVGEPYTNGYTDYVDRFVFGTANGTTIFDFEPDAVAVDCDDPATAPSYAGGYVLNDAKNRAFAVVEIPAGGVMFEFYKTRNIVIGDPEADTESGTVLTGFTRSGNVFDFGWDNPSPTTVYFPIWAESNKSTSVAFFIKAMDTCERNMDVDPEFALGAADEQIEGFALSAQPNLFSGQTTLRFSLEEAGQARLSVYDVLGREVATVANDVFAAGEQSVRFDAAGLSSGLYLVRLEAGGRALTQTITIAR